MPPKILLKKRPSVVLYLLSNFTKHYTLWPIMRYDNTLRVIFTLHVWYIYLYVYYINYLVFISISFAKLSPSEVLMAIVNLYEEPGSSVLGVCIANEISFVAPGKIVV